MYSRVFICFATCSKRKEIYPHLGKPTKIKNLRQRDRERNMIPGRGVEEQDFLIYPKLGIIHQVMHISTS